MAKFQASTGKMAPNMGFSSSGPTNETGYTAPEFDYYNRVFEMHVALNWGLMLSEN